MVWKSKAFPTCLALAAVCGMMMQGPSLGYAQYPTVPGAETRAVAQPEGRAMGESATTIIPSLRLAERYDSNVFFVRGRNLEDYVTTIAPQLKVTHSSQWVEGVIAGGARGEVYAKNPGLNYVGGNGFVDLNFDRAMNTFVRGMRLQVSDTITYTPQPPAFAAPTSGNQVSDAFVEGLQARRANSFRNVLKTEIGYFFLPHMGVFSTYTDRRLRFGKSVDTPDGVVPSGEFINANFQTLTSGIVGQPSEVDTLSFFHLYQKATFVNPVSGAGGFSTQGAMARWSRALTSELQVMGEGGFSVLSQSNVVYPVSSASLEWKGQYTMVRVSYSRAIAQSFLFIATPLLSQSVSGVVTRQIAEPFSLSLSGSYAVNHSVPNDSLLHFESYSVTPSLEYRIGPNLNATLSYTRSDFQRTFSEQSVGFDRNMIMLNLMAEWR